MNRGSYSEVFNPFYHVQIVDEQVRKALNKVAGRGAYKRGDFLAQIPPEDIISFEFEDCATQADELKIVVRDDNLEKLDSGNYVHDNYIRFTFGQLGGPISEPRVMIIKGVNPDFSASGLPTLEIVAYDQGVTLATKFRRKNWGKVPSSQIALEIAKLNDFEAQVDETDDLPKQDIMQPPNISDMQFLVRLAKKVGYMVYMEGNTLYYRKKPLDEVPRKTFVYRNPDGQQMVNTMLSFRPKSNTIKPSGESTGDGKKQDKATSETSKQAALAKFRAISNLSGEQRPEMKPDAPGVKHTPSPGDQKRAASEAQSRHDAQQLSMFAGEISAIGDATTKAKSVIHLKGVGIKYSGNYFIDKVRHRILAGSGYLMEITVNRDGLNRGKAEQKNSGSTKVNAAEEARQKFRTISNLSGAQTQ